MKLASLKNGTRDGRFVVVSRDLRRACDAGDIAPTLQAALDTWATSEAALVARAANLAGGAVAAFSFDQMQCESPLPRAYQWLDGSSYLSHVARVRAARGATMNPEATSDPLMYQGDSDYFIGPRDDIAAASEAWGIDLEAEVAVITADVPLGVSAAHARDAIRLVMLVNDVSLRNLIPAELAKGFGFLHGKGQTAFSPVAVTPDELGTAWNGDVLALPLRVTINGNDFGHPNAGVDMTFAFPELIAHAAKTRPLGAGTIVGSGTVSNRDTTVGYGCISEIRAVETVQFGNPVTPFFAFGDRVTIEMLDAHGASIFGTIDQRIVPIVRS